jgi:aerobic carbon-monoxide dehydrogenase large subunit
MNRHISDQELATTKFAVGQPVRRSEDPKLVRGLGQYTDDVSLEGEVFGVVVRSPHAHGRIRRLETERARAMPGVLAVYTARDLAGYGSLDCRLAMESRDGAPLRRTPRLALAADRVRYAGDPVAFVVATSAAQAQDAADAVDLEIDALPAVTDARAAVAPDAPQLYDDVPGNVVLDYHFGDADKVAAAFAAAAHVARLRIVNSRIVVNPMEPRAVVADYDAQSGRFTLYAPTQGVIGSRDSAAALIKVAPEKIRFVAVNVGGSFGMKGAIFPEYVCAMHAARALGRPVKWTDRRSESFVSDYHGRDHDFLCELALDADGRFLAVRAEGFGNLGAYLTPFGPMMPTFNIVKHLNSCYRTPLIEVNARCVLTNTSPVTAYRGAGRPEGNYYMERLIEAAAQDIGLSSVELRRRNHIKPEELPYRAPSGSNYDSGDFPAVLDKAMEAADWRGFPERKAQSESRGRLRGFGVGQFLEVTAPIQKELGGIKFEDDGTVSLFTGSHDHGQGHATSFAQIVAEKLGLPFERLRLMQTDSDLLKGGTGTGGSKSLISSGTAFLRASEKVVEKGRAAASHLLEAAPLDLEFVDGSFSVAGTDRAISLLEIAERLRRAPRLPEDCPRTLDVDHFNEPAPPTFPNGCHVCEVEIDPETGAVAVVKYTMVDDFGTVVNPLLVDGQLQGGVAQGVGQILLERTVYSEDGQLGSGSFTDYAMPRADDLVFMDSIFLSAPATTNPLGAKGCGEAGCAGSMASVMNAVIDALRPLGISDFDMPATPHRVWSAIRAARRPKPRDLL